MIACINKDGILVWMREHDAPEYEIFGIHDIVNYQAYLHTGMYSSVLARLRLKFNITLLKINNCLRAVDIK